MLGFNTKREQVAGKFARDIQQRMKRIQTGNLSKEDLAEIKKSRQVARKVSVVWK